MAVDQHIDEGPVQGDGLIVLDQKRSPSSHFHCGGGTSPGSFLRYGDEGLAMAPGFRTG